MGDFTALILAGVAKIYAGELVEEARALMTMGGEVGPIEPVHLKMAFNKLQQQGKLDFHSINLAKLLS